MMKILNKNRILVIEPSPFRRDETYILGPFNKIWAWIIAFIECDKHPFCEIQVVDSKLKVSLGNKVLWPGKDIEIINNINKGIYR